MHTNNIVINVGINADKTMPTITDININTIINSASLICVLLYVLSVIYHNK